MSCKIRPVKRETKQGLEKKKKKIDKEKDSKDIDGREERA